MRRFLAPVLASLAVAVVPAPVRSTESPAFDHLRRIVDLSPAPDYRRAGSAGMAAVADYAADRLGDYGYEVVRHDFSFERWAVDYANPPMLLRDDGMAFKTESAFNLGSAATGPDGVDCVVKAVNQVSTGDCGFIPFEDASPEWKSEPFATVGSQASQVAARGGVGVVVQGDVRRDAVFAQSLRNRGIPGVVAVVHGEEVLGRTVTLRAAGSFQNATGRNVIGVLRPEAQGAGYVMLLAHADGWFQAAADNGSGVAGVLRAAESLAGDRPGVGVIVAVVDAEEVGLVGSDRLAQKMDTGLVVVDGGPPLTVADLRAIVNLDASTARASDVQDFVRGIARTDAPLFQWRAMVASEEEVLLPAFLARFGSHGIFGLPLTARVWRPFASGGNLDGGYRTDVQAFAQRGVPFVWPVAGYPEYHTDADTLGTVDPGDLEAVAAAAAGMVRDIAELPADRLRPDTASASVSRPPPDWLHAHLDGHDH